MKNLLMIGNGFDIYHKLPTRYIDFIFLAANWESFSNKYKESTIEAIDSKRKVKINLSSENKLCNESLDSYIKNKDIFNQKEIEYLETNLVNNAWIKYFINKLNGDYNWIDVEKEIEKVLSRIDNYYQFVIDHNYTSRNIIIDMVDIEIKDIMKFFSFVYDECRITGYGILASDVKEFWESSLHKREGEFICKLKDELIVLTECLRIYINQFILPIQIDVFSTQIDDINEPYVLSFNYTNTYKDCHYNKYYANHQIHGDCINGKIVLGVSDDFNDEIIFNPFKKLIQRIEKNVGNYYVKFLEGKDESNEYFESSDINVYCVGMSFDTMDSSIIRNVLENKNVVKITIFYYNEVSKNSIIDNLITIFTSKWLSDNYNNDRLEFVELKPAQFRS